MNLRIPMCAAILLLALPAVPVIAGPGHDHGEQAAAAATVATPRFVAESEIFELVGVLEGRRLTLWLDHAPSNESVKNARLSLELAGTALEAKPAGEGMFGVELAQVLPAGVHALTATIVTDAQSDLLAGELDIREGPSPLHTGLHVFAAEALKYGLPALLLAAVVLMGLRWMRSRRTA